ncbi:MAG: hypothetical protein F6K09_35200, partial [Merismopedia sp. SIO2A8]|nr:hypothetical protein [Merismopedia sp. SIO2A8]
MIAVNLKGKYSNLAVGHPVSSKAYRASEALAGVGKKPVLSVLGQRREYVTTKKRFYYVLSRFKLTQADHKGMFRHPEGRLHFAWNCTQLGLLILPLMPTFGIIGLLLASAETWRQKHRQIIRTPLNWGLALLSFWLIITACFALNRTEAFLGLANLLPFFAVFAAFSVLIQTPAQLNRLAWMMVMPSLPVAILGLGQHFLGWKGLEQLNAVLGWVLAEGGNPPGRMASVFMYANILAAYLQIVLILSIGLWIEQFRAWRKIPNNSQNSKLWFLSILVIAQVIALFLTSSRNGWAIAILACLAFALYLGWHWLVTAAVTAAT